MSDKRLALLDEALNTLRDLDYSAIAADGTSVQLLEVKKGSNGEVLINGNRDGLIHFARLVVEIANKGFSGAHQHFDEAGELDACEVPLIVSLKAAEWEM